MSDEKTIDLFLERAAVQRRLNQVLASVGNAVTLLALLAVTILLVNGLTWLLAPLIPKLTEFAILNVAPFRWIVSLLLMIRKAALIILPFGTQTVLLLFGIGLASGIILILRSWFKPISSLTVAKEIDVRYGLFDRLSSAVEFAAKGEKSDFIRAAKTDAAAHIGGLDARQAVPLEVPRRIHLKPTLAAYAATMTVTIAVALILALAISPVTSAKNRLKVDTSDLHRSLEDLMADAARNGDHVSENINKKIQDILSKLEKGELTKEEAMKELSDLQKEIQQDQEQAGEQDAEQAMKQMASDFAKSEMSSDVADQLQQKNAEAAAEKMEELSKEVGNGDQTQQQKNDLRDALNAASKTAGSSQDADMQQMSKDLKQSADDMSKGDNKGASEQLQKAAQDMKNMAQKEGNNQRLEDAKKQLDNIRDSVRSAAEQKNDGSQQQGGQQNGQPKPNDNKASNGQQGGDQKGQPGDQKDQNSSQSQNGQQQADQNANGNQGQGLNAGAQEGDKKLVDPSERTDAKKKDEIQGEAGDEKPPMSDDKKSDLTATTNYKNTVTAAQRSAQDVINHDDVPPSYRRVVKKYFNSIKPKK